MIDAQAIIFGKPIQLEHFRKLAELLGMQDLYTALAALNFIVSAAGDTMLPHT
ncbi:hypothetical protein ACX0KM_12845 [Pseudomonas promysalinigenes]